MSQLPPNPYGSPPPPQYPPPGQFPPGQFPPGQYPTGGYPPPYGPPRTSGAAIASLVLGILGICPLPLVGGLIAVILGVVGLGTTGKPNTKGRGLAIAGVVLGLLSLLGYAGLGSFLYAGYRATAPDRATSVQFVRDLAAGDVAHAATLCQPGADPVALQATSDQLKALGTPSAVIPVGFNFNATTSGNRSQITVFAQFGQAQKQVMVVLTPGPAGGGRLIQHWSLLN